MRALSTGSETLEMLAAMNNAINTRFDFVRREDEGTQPPATTIERLRGSCRDFALGLLEAVRCLRTGARFISRHFLPETGAVLLPEPNAWLQVSALLDANDAVAHQSLWNKSHSKRKMLVGG
jgi:transglutaminase-like putative cysteine protease